MVKNYMIGTAIDADYAKKVKEEYAGYEKPDFTATQWKDKLTEVNENTANTYNMLDIATLKNIFDGSVSTQKLILEFYEKGNQETIQAIENVGNSKAKSEAAIKELNTIAPLLEKNFSEFKKRYAAINAKTQVETEFFTDSKRYENAMAEMKDKLALNKKVRIKLILQSFLDASATIDFAAQTYTNAEGVKIFVNPDYEQKPYD